MAATKERFPVAVFLSANELSPKYTVPAALFGQLLAEHGYRFVYGGTDKGLMKTVADEVEKAGGEISAVSCELFRSEVRPGIQDVCFAPDIAERKKLLVKKSAAFVILPGGTGTIDEVTEIIELKRHSIEEKPIIFLSIDGYWQGLQQQFEKMEAEGFLTRPLDQLLYFAESPREAIEYLDKYFSRPSGLKVLDNASETYQVQ